MSSNPTIVFEKPHRVVIAEREKPIPQNGELLIRTRCTLISTGTELTVLSGEFPPNSAWSEYGRFPFSPGYDNIGEVIAVGANVDPGWIGKRVASGAHHELYHTIKIEEARVIQRENVTDEQAAFFTIAEIVMNGVRRAQVQWGEAVVVFGLGLLGQLTARFCRLSGARPVFGVDISDYRLDLLPKEASVIPVRAKSENVTSMVERFTRQRMADVVFEVTGDQHLIPEQFKTLKRQGRFVVLGSPRGATAFDLHDLCNAPSFTIIGAHITSHPPVESLDHPWTRKRHAELFFDLVADGELQIDPLISHRAPYGDAPQLYQMLLEDRSKVMGVILDWMKE